MNPIFRPAAWLSCVLLCASLPARGQSKPAGPARLTPAASAPAGKGDPFARWEKEIAAYEAQDRANPPKKGGVLFIGSSTIRLWKTLEKDFAGHPVLNRGFGGSQIEDSTHFAERIIFPYEPRLIVLRAGGNDIHAGKTPERVFADFKAFAGKVHARLPRTPIVYVSICPVPSRWPERDACRTLNTLVAAYVKERPYLRYVETYDMVLDAGGQARPELFAADRLHFSPAGYRLLADRVRPLLERSRP
jgi:lysophospholipase L1-like esterase